MSRLPLLVYYGMGGVLARIALIRVGNGADAGVGAGRLVDGARAAAAGAGLGGCSIFGLSSASLRAPESAAECRFGLKSARLPIF